jgi:membrane protein
MFRTGQAAQRGEPLIADASWNLQFVASVYVRQVRQATVTWEPGMGTPRQAWGMLKSTFLGWLADGCPSMGAAIAYYAVFSLAPLLILIIAIAGLAFGYEASRGAIVSQLGGLVGRDGATALQTMIQSAANKDSGIVATFVGIGALLLGATGVLGEIQSALNVVWKAAPRKENTILSLVRKRLLSLSLVVAMGFLLLTSLVVSTALAVVSNYLAGKLPGSGIILEIVNFAVSLATITVLFASIFKILPDAPVAWRDVWVGAGLSALLFTVGKSLIGLYIGSSNVASSYGAAGALVVILLWVYYTAQILLFGAEITRAYAERRGLRAPHATHQASVSSPQVARGYETHMETKRGDRRWWRPFVYLFLELGFVLLGVAIARDGGRRYARPEPRSSLQRGHR